jgi:hypothetical protein
MGSVVLCASYLVVLVLFLGLPLQGNSRKHNAVSVPSALVGNVYCDTCSDQQGYKLGHFISG